MIISHKHKFIFLKTNKTAGTSIEIALSKYCGPEDVITPITREDEAMRSSLGYPGPQNCYAPIWSYRFKDIFKWLTKGKKKLRFYNHITAKEAKQYIGDDIWNSYYKFCFERNPWDRCISLYYWRYKSEPRPPIAEFVNSQEPMILKKRGYELYTIDGKIAVDKICRFENLVDELEQVRKQIGLPEKLDLPRAKSKYRKDKAHYRDLLTEAEKAKIAELFHDEIRSMGYEW